MFYKMFFFNIIKRWTSGYRSADISCQACRCSGCVMFEFNDTSFCKKDGYEWGRCVSHAYLFK